MTGCKLAIFMDLGVAIRTRSDTKSYADVSQVVLSHLLEPVSIHFWTASVRLVTVVVWSTRDVEDCDVSMDGLGCVHCRECATGDAGSWPLRMLESGHAKYSSLPARLRPYSARTRR
jgi:hypothetical protein